MQQYKIDLLNKELSQINFPEYFALENEECKQLVNTISNDLLNKDIDSEFWKDIVNVLRCKQYMDVDTLKLKDVFIDCEFNCKDDIYIIWRKDEVDVMKTSLLIEYWDDIWYPPSDELVILYCGTTRKLLLITHWGNVYY